MLFLKKCVGLSFISLITRNTSASLLNISGCFNARLFKFAIHSSLNTPLKSFIHFSTSNLCRAYCFAEPPSLIVQPSPFTTSCFASACSSLLPCSAVSPCVSFMICLISGIISVLNFSRPVFVRLSIFSLGIASIFLITTLRSPTFLSAFAMWFFRAWLLPR